MSSRNSSPTWDAVQKIAPIKIQKSIPEPQRTDVPKKKQPQLYVSDNRNIAQLVQTLAIAETQKQRIVDESTKIKKSLELEKEQLLQEIQAVKEQESKAKKELEKQSIVISSQENELVQLRNRNTRPEEINRLEEKLDKIQTEIHHINSQIPLMKKLLSPKRKKPKPATNIQDQDTPNKNESLDNTPNIYRNNDSNTSNHAFESKRHRDDTTSSSSIHPEPLSLDSMLLKLLKSHPAVIETSETRQRMTLAKELDRILRTKEQSNLSASMDSQIQEQTSLLEQLLYKDKISQPQKDSKVDIATETRPDQNVTFANTTHSPIAKPLRPQETKIYKEASTNTLKAVFEDSDPTSSCSIPSYQSFLITPVTGSKPKKKVLKKSTFDPNTSMLFASDTSMLKSLADVVMDIEQSVIEDIKEQDDDDDMMDVISSLNGF